MSHTAERIEVVQLLRRLSRDNESTGDTILRALREGALEQTEMIDMRRAGADKIERFQTALRRIRSLAEKNISQAHQIAQEALKD